MPTLADLISERRGAIEKFKEDIYGHGDYDISVLNDAIAKTPVAIEGRCTSPSRFIRDQAAEPPQHLIHSAAAALRKFIEGL
jgi:hypothetical protein